ncbi:MAG TPA: hypothetical protein VFB54_17310 [Burkholderiales bacterium]|nr:hypothetical protein [Burkholderiales bacterium]
MFVIMSDSSSLMTPQATVAMADGHDAAILGQHQIGIEDPLIEPPQDVGLSRALQAPTRGLIEEAHNAAVMVVHFAPVLEEHFDRIGRDAPLLHPHLRVLRESGVTCATSTLM